MSRLYWWFFAWPLCAQYYAGLSLPFSGNNQKAAVTQFIGPVKVTVEYSSPAVHGPATPAGGPSVDRRGKIWGGLVPYGLNDLGFGTAKKAPWRAGANENTVFEVSEAVTIEGQPLAAGRYGLHVIVEPEEWTLIFSKNAGAWGSFFYEEKDDALRVKVKPRRHEYREYLTYEFVNRKPTEATAELQWEDLAAGWTIRVAKPEEVYLTRLRKELKNGVGFQAAAWVAAIQFCVQNNINLDEALEWADYAISGPFVGQRSFTTLSAKSQVLNRLGREAEAAEVMKSAFGLPGTTVFEVHQYGRQLQNANKNREALEVFEFNARRFGDIWPTHVGLARGYGGVGNKVKALDHARKALPQAPDEMNRKAIEGLIETFSR